MSVDGSVYCFATFHNVNCAQGFLYLNRKVCSNSVSFLNLLTCMYCCRRNFGSVYCRPSLTMMPRGRCGKCHYVVLHILSSIMSKPRHTFWPLAWPNPPIEFTGKYAFTYYSGDGTLLIPCFCRKIRFNGDDKELSLEERDDRFPYPHVEKFAIQLISPVTWEVSVLLKT